MQYLRGKKEFAMTEKNDMILEFSVAKFVRLIEFAKYFLGRISGVFK